MFGHHFVSHTNQTPVPRNACLDLRVMGAVKPGNPPAPTKTGNRQTIDIGTLPRRPRHCRVEIAHYLRVRRLVGDIGQNIGDARILARITLPSEEFGPDRAVALLGEAATGVLDVFVSAEYLGNHQHHGRFAARFGLGPIGNHFAILDRHPDFTCQQPDLIGLDHRLRHYRLHSEGKTGPQTGHQKAPTIKGTGRNQAIKFGIFAHGLSAPGSLQNRYINTMSYCSGE